MNHVIFDGTYVARSSHGVLTTLVQLGLGVPSVSIAARYLPRAAGFIETAVSMMFIGMGIMLVLLGLLRLRELLSDARVSVQLTRTGIRRGDRARSWSEIARIDGVRLGDRVGLRYTLSRDIAWLGEGDLRTTPLLSHEQYRAIVADLSALVAPAFPSLDIGQTPVAPD